MKKILSTLLLTLFAFVSACGGGTDFAVGTTYTNDSLGFSFAFPYGYEIVEEQVAGEMLVLHIKNVGNEDVESTTIVLSANAQIPPTVADVEYEITVENRGDGIEVIGVEQREQIAALNEVYTRFYDSNGVLYFLLMSTTLDDEEMVQLFGEIITTFELE